VQEPTVVALLEPVVLPGQISAEESDQENSTAGLRKHLIWAASVFGIVLVVVVAVVTTVVVLLKDDNSDVVLPPTDSTDTPEPNTSSPAPTPIPPGLVHRYKGEGDAVDFVGGFQYDGLLGPATKFQEGINGLAFDFNSTSEAMVRLGANIDPTINPTMTSQYFFAFAVNGTGSDFWEISSHTLFSNQCCVYFHSGALGKAELHCHCQQPWLGFNAG